MSGWLTIPAWAGVVPRDVVRAEGGPAPDPVALQNVHALVRGEFDLPPGAWTLELSADDYCHAWLDGTWLGQGGASFSREKKKQKELQSRPPASEISSVSPEEEKQAESGTCWYQFYPVTGGRTVTLALHVYYQGLVNRVWNSGDGRFGFWVRFVRGEKAVVPGPEQWRCQVCTACSGEVTGYDTQFLENFDSRLWPEGWEQPGFDDSAWEHPIPAGWADYVMAPQPTENLWRGRADPVSRTAVPGGVLLDFGRERVGTLHAKARGKAGTCLTLRFGEELDEKGRVRYDMRCSCRYEERWTLGDGESVLHQFDYKAFRYAEILGLDAPRAELTQCWVWERHYPMEDGLCTLSCKTDQLEDIFRICKNAVRCGSQESFLDCPSREKGQYLGDAVITARSQVWLTGKTDLLRKCIGDFMASAEAAPSLLAVSPGALRQEVADFSLLFPLLPLTDYDFTGDRDFLKNCYPILGKIQDVFLQYRRPDGLLENVSHAWNLVDWPEQARDGYDFPLTRPVVGEGCHNVINALWYGFLTMKERIERILSLPVTEESRRVGEAFLRVFYRPAQRLFADSAVSGHCSLHANLYPACFGLTPDADAYAALLETTGRSCGPFPSYFALRGLARLGRYDTLYRLLTRTDAYGWRNMLREGATACFEAWGRDQKWNTSLCHPWASGAIPLLIEELAGLHPDPDAPGGFRFEPHLPGGLGDLALQAPFRGRLLRVELKNGQTVLTVLPGDKKGE